MSKKILILILFSALLAESSWADDYFFIIRKQEQKKSRRWNLDDWLDQRDRMRMMDLWLALHSPEPYEFYLMGQYQTGSLRSGPYSGGWEGAFAAYVYLFGVEIKRESFSFGTATEAMFHLRLFGLQAQGTNLMLMGGVEHNDRAGLQQWHPKVGATLTWYLYKAFGIEAGYRYLFEKTNTAQSLSGNRWNAGALLDFSFVRIYGGYFQVSENGTLALPRRGAYLGSKIFF